MSTAEILALLRDSAKNSHKLAPKTVNPPKKPKENLKIVVLEWPKGEAGNLRRGGVFSEGCYGPCGPGPCV